MVCLYLSTVRWDVESALIRWATRCPWSHAGFVETMHGAERLDGACAYLSAQLDGGVQFRYSHPAGGGRCETFSAILYLTAPGVEAAYAWAKTQVGRKYDWAAIAGFGLDNDWHDSARLFCSELVAEGFERIGKPLLNPSAAVWRITPRDLLLSPGVRVIGN
jgi:hypothetical protein